MNRFAGLMRIFILAFLLVALLTAVVIWLSMPRLLAFSPQDGAVDIPARNPLTLQFTRLMQPDSVEERLVIEPAVPGRYSWEGPVLTFIPDEPWPAGELIHVQLGSGAVASGFFALPFQGEAGWSFSVRQPRLVFLFPANGPANLYMRDPLGAANQYLTNSLAGVQDFSIVSGGEKIVFSARSPQGGSDLYLLDLSSQSPDTLPTENARSTEGAVPAPPQPQMLLSCSPGNCRLPSISLDGNFLAFERSDASTSTQPTRSHVWYAPADRPQEGVMTGDPAHTTTSPVWAPQGWLTYYDQDAQVFVVIKPGGDEQARFPNETGQSGSWQPSGQGFVAPEISFLDANVSGALQNLERLANSHLILYPFPQADAIDLSQEEGLEDAVPVFSPDGASLVYARKFLDARRWSPGRQMWLMNVDRRQARSLTDDPEYNHYDFAWSPDGRQLAYVRFNQSLLTEPPEIWVMDLQTGQQQLLIGGGYAPQWIP